MSVLTTAFVCPGTIKCLQVEGNICVTGGTDGKIRVWDLDQVEMNDPSGTKPPPPPAASAQSVESTLLGSVKEEGNAEEGERPLGEGEGSSVRVLDGHTMDVTCLYFDNNCLVSCLSGMMVFACGRLYSSLEMRSSRLPDRRTRLCANGT